MDTKQQTVFVSYARADRIRVEKLIGVLQHAGLRVWWDALIEGGEAFAKSIEAALDDADVILVMWSKSSATSDWVRDEAAHGRDRGRLVPVSLDGSLPPLGFRQYHYIDMTHWGGSAAASEIDLLLNAIATTTGAPPPAPRTHTTTSGASALMVRRRGVLIASGAFGIAALGGGAALWHYGLTDTAASANSIAVMPFLNLSNDATQNYFSDGLSEELRAKLGQSGQFKVAAQTSSNQFRDHKADAVTAAAKLGVAYLLDGSVRKSGDTVRVVTELIEARSGLSRWSESFDRKLTDIFAVQTEIATRVMLAVAGQITQPAKQALAGTSNIAAYDTYLKGRAAFNSDIDEASERQALAYFDAAIAADPNYAAAYVGRSRTLANIAGNYAKSTEIHKVFDDAMSAAQKAISLAPNYAEAHLALGQAQYGGKLNFQYSRPSYDRAYALGQNDADILELFAYYASRSGRSTEAIAAINKAIPLDPLNPLMFRAKGKILYGARRFADAIPVLRVALSMNPKLSNTSAAIGDALVALKKYPEAHTAYLAEPRADLRLTGLAIVSHKMGDEAAAQKNTQALISQYGDTALYQQAQILCQAGKLDAAFVALNKARDIGDSGITLFPTDPLLDALRTDARYAALLSRVGLTTV